MIRGLVFNIQRFCLHDGPGIRTNVFFKGCPLNCRWCSNPESKNNRAEIVFNSRKCILCLKCIDACPNGGIIKTEDGMRIDRDQCVMCLKCIDACVARALYIEGENYTVDELLAEVLKDSEFYKKSGGGVTLSGGEPLMQKDFVLEFLKALKKHEIHVVAETTGCIDSESFKQLIGMIDILYFDVKHPDNAKHKDMIGEGNEQILHNLEFAVKSGREVVARLPVIREYNNSQEAVDGYIRLFRKTGLKKIHLLPFHNYGAGKYEMLGLNYEYRNTPNMEKEELAPMRDVLMKAGFEVQIGGG
jgi:pyruvate formate lyase activating enzyme